MIINEEIALPSKKYPIRVLMTEEYPVNSRIIYRLLQSKEYIRIQGIEPIRDNIEKALNEFPTDILLLGIFMDIIDYESFIKNIRRKFENIKIVIFYEDTDTTMLSGFKSLGINGILSKSANFATIVDVMKVVYDGGSYFPTPSIKIEDFTPKYLEHYL